MTDKKQQKKENTEQEIWKPITYLKLGRTHEVSNKGNVRSRISGEIIKTSLRSGYKSVAIGGVWCKNHRIVALTFIPNDNPLKKQVNHIDGNKLNNCVENLEWVTAKENNQHSIKNGLSKITTKKVIQCDLTGKEIKTFESILDAHNALQIDDGSIVKVCKGRQKTAGGYTWKYAIENNDEDIDEKPIVAFDKKDYKEITEYGNHKVRKGYFVKKDGTIFSQKTHMYLKHSVQADGFEYVYLSDGKKDFQCLIHRLVAMYFIPNCNVRQGRIIHIDKNKSNNNVENLKIEGHIEIKKIEEKPNNESDNDKSEESSSSDDEKKTTKKVIKRR